MTPARLSDLRPRGVLDLLDDAFDCYRERFALLAGLGAIGFVPAHLLNLVLTTETYMRFEEASKGSENPLPSLGVFLVALLVEKPFLSLAAALQGGAAALAVSESLAGGWPTQRSVWRRLLPRIPALIGLGLLTALLHIAAACMTLGIGMLFVSAVTGLGAALIVLEGRGVSESLVTAWRRLQESLARAIGLVVLLGLLGFTLALGLTLLAEGLAYFAPGSWRGGERANFVTGQVAEALGSLCVAPLQGVAFALLYYDLGVRRDGLDIAALAAEKGVPLADSPRSKRP